MPPYFVRADNVVDEVPSRALRSLAVIVAAPCTAPFMAAALGYAVTQPAATALLVFGALGLGFATPFILIAFSPTVIRVLPRPGPWLSRTKAILALPMYGAALWLGWVFWRQAGPGPVLILTGTAAIFAAAAWVYGRRQTARLEGWTYPPSPVVLAILISLSGIGLAWAAAAPREVAGADADLGAEAWSTERLTALRAEGRPVLVNFTADWCLSCKTNEATALSSRRVADALARTTMFDAVPGVKWPNDVLIGERKVAGVLSEYSTRVLAGGSGRDGQAVIGIGVNTSMTPDQLPVPEATSVFVETGRAIDDDELAVDILRELDVELAMWPSRLDELAQEYRSKCVTLGQRVRLVLPGDNELIGTAVDVDAQGRLLVTADGGSTTAVAAGDVTHLRAHPQS